MKSIIFVKEYPESLVIGHLTSEPNQDGEQDYEGYSVSPSSLEFIKSGEDFLSADEVARLLTGRGAADEDTYKAIGQLYTELIDLAKREGIALEALEDADATTSVAVSDLISRAYSIVKRVHR